MTDKEIFAYVKKKYHTLPEYLWSKTPDAAVLRHESNQKWYAAVLTVSGRQLNLPEETMQEASFRILNVKCDTDMVSILCHQRGFLPAYHMNKEHWITILIEQVEKDIILDLLDKSYDMIDHKISNKKNLSVPTS